MKPPRILVFKSLFGRDWACCPPDADTTWHPTKEEALAAAKAFAAARGLEVFIKPTLTRAQNQKAAIQEYRDDLNKAVKEGTR